VRELGGGAVTCEVMLMNLEGVALAADSAVTVVDGRGTAAFSQNGVDKIFILDESAPIGAMVYGLATFADYPWRTVVAAFQTRIKAKNKPFAGVQDCADRLIAFLGSLDASGSAGISLTPKAEVDAFRQYVEGFVDRLFVLTAQRAKTGDGPFPNDLMEQALKDLEEEILQEADYAPGQIVKQSSAHVARAAIGRPTERLAKFLAQHTELALNRSLKRYFNSSNIQAPLRERITRLLSQSVLVDWLPPASWYTGVVAAGFGRKDFTPFFVNLHILGAFGGVVKHRYEKAGAPIAGRSPVVFESYAQNELITAFRSGAQPRFMRIAYYATVAGIAQTFGEVLDIVAKKDQTLAREAAVIARRAVTQVPAVAFGHAVADREAHIASTLGPLLDSASLDTLGRHAAKLVQLSILEHELTGSGAVGRPISLLKMEKGKCRLEKDAST
jgi:hypothetical protein